MGSQPGRCVRSAYGASAGTHRKGLQRPAKRVGGVHSASEAVRPGRLQRVRGCTESEHDTETQQRANVPLPRMKTCCTARWLPNKRNPATLAHATTPGSVVGP